MAGPLGCVNNYSVFITDVCGSPKICDLTDLATSIKWQRTLDNISQATITIAKPGNTSLDAAVCCQCIADIEPWCHEIQIFRDTEFVWCGPVIEVDEKIDTVTITAKDLLAWLDVRFFKTGDSHGNSFDFSLTPLPVTEVAKEIILAACDPTIIAQAPIGTEAIPDYDPCLTKNLIIYPSTIPAGAVFKALDGTAFSMLQQLSKNSLDFTTYGRSIILGTVSEFDINPIGTLTMEHILGDISFKKDGNLYGNRYIMRFVNDDTTLICTPDFPPCPEIVDSPNRYCHGFVERLIQDSIGNANPVFAQQIGQVYVQQTGTRSPRTIDFGGGATLSPTTPWGINDMVPGMLVNTSLTGFCIDDGIQQFRITEINVTFEADKDEVVQLTMSPLNQATGSL